MDCKILLLWRKVFETHDNTEVHDYMVPLGTCPLPDQVVDISTDKGKNEAKCGVSESEASTLSSLRENDMRSLAILFAHIDKQIKRYCTSTSQVSAASRFQWQGNACNAFIVNDLGFNCFESMGERYIWYWVLLKNCSSKKYSICNSVCWFEQCK